MNIHSTNSEKATEQISSTVTLSTRVSRDVARKVKEKAAQHRVSEAWVIREAVLVYIGEGRVSI